MIIKGMLGRRVYFCWNPQLTTEGKIINSITKLGIALVRPRI